MTVDNELPLLSLLKRVAEIRERIDKHGDALRKSEAQTRYSLIDPLLRALGWDTTDPAQVVPEYRGDGGRQAADYALLGPLGQPLVIIEAKHLYEPLREHVAQACPLG